MKTSPISTPDCITFFHGVQCRQSGSRQYNFTIFHKVQYRPSGFRQYNFGQQFSVNDICPRGCLCVRPLTCTEFSNRYFNFVLIFHFSCFILVYVCVSLVYIADLQLQWGIGFQRCLSAAQTSATPTSTSKSIPGKLRSTPAADEAKGNLSHQVASNNKSTLQTVSDPQAVAKNAYGR